MRTRAFFLLLLPTLLFSQNYQLGGYVKFFAHPNLNAPYPFDRLGSRLQLRLSNSFNEHAAFFSAIDFNYESTASSVSGSLSRSAGMDIYPVETYVDLFFSKVDIRLGQQFIFWGRTDWVNPTDNINPWDYRNISAEIEDYRIPVPAAKADFYLGNFDLEAVWLPVFQAHSIPMEIPDSIGVFKVVHEPTRFPENKVSNSQFGLHLSSSTAGIDYSFSYFRGYAKSPTVHIRMNPALGQFIEQTEYSTLQVFGADFVTTFHKFAFKGEGAYFLTSDRNGKDIFAENPYLQYVLGLDYNASNDLTFNVQFIQKISFQYDLAYEKTIRIQNHMPLNDLPDQYVQSASGRIQYQLSDFTTVQFISVYNFKDGDFFALPILNYGLADGVNIYAGGTLFSGPKTSPFGRSKKYSRAFVEIKYSF